MRRIHWRARRRNAALLLLPLLVGAVRSDARELAWRGTLEVELGFGDPLAFTGSGLATLAGSGTPGVALTTLRLDGGITGTAAVPITDPDIAGTLPRVELSAALGAGTLGPFHPTAPFPEPQLSRAALPVGGTLRLCSFDPSCAFFLPVPLTRSSGARGIGVGGLVTGGGFGDVRISLAAGPWTPWTATLTQPTPLGGVATLASTGWLHGPASFASTAGQAGGEVRLVSPIRITSTQAAQPIAAVNRLTLRFVPEPGILLLLLAGILGLACLGRSRDDGT